MVLASVLVNYNNPGQMCSVPSPEELFLLLWSDQWKTFRSDWLREPQPCTCGWERYESDIHPHTEITHTHTHTQSGIGSLTLRCWPWSWARRIPVRWWPVAPGPSPAPNTAVCSVCPSARGSAPGRRSSPVWIWASGGLPHAPANPR